MSIEILGVGKRIDKYSYCVAWDNKNDWREHEERKHFF